MARHLLSIDQGTTGSTVLLVGQDTRVLARASIEFPQHFPQPGWVEHEPEEIWQSVLTALRHVYRGSDSTPEECVGIGITNQRETTVVWDRATGQPIHRAIVWQDRRTAATCRALETAGHLPVIRERTGLVLDAYFSGTKIAWILDHVEGARDRAARGELAFGTIDSFLVWRLSGGKAHVTDVSNASRTLLFDLHEMSFSDQLCGILDVPKSVLPEVRSCSEVYAKTASVPGLPDGVPIAGMAGDQQSALFGQTCFSVGDAKCTYGTGAFLLVNTGERAVPSQNGCLTTVAWSLGGSSLKSGATYALEGSSFIAGAAVQWLRDGLGIIQRSSEIEALARKVESSEGVYFVPALSGLGAPYWDPDARGTISGLTRGSTTAHLARATLEGIAFSVADLARAMEADMGGRIARLRVDGGASENTLLMQFQSDVLDVAIDRPEMVDTTALGAAYLAGLAVGVFADLDAVRKAHRIAHTFEPVMSEAKRAERLDGWRVAVQRSRGTL